MKCRMMKEKLSEEQIKRNIFNRKFIRVMDLVCAYADKHQSNYKSVWERLLYRLHDRTGIDLYSENDIKGCGDIREITWNANCLDELWEVAKDSFIR